MCPSTRRKPLDDWDLSNWFTDISLVMIQSKQSIYTCLMNDYFSFSAVYLVVKKMFHLTFLKFLFYFSYCLPCLLILSVILFHLFCHFRKLFEGGGRWICFSVSPRFLLHRCILCIMPHVLFIYFVSSSSHNTPWRWAGHALLLSFCRWQNWERRVIAQDYTGRVTFLIHACWLKSTMSLTCG